MSLFPLVGTALRAYEQGKASSRVVKVRLLRHVVQLADSYMEKYGAQMVESGMKTISKPVIDRLPVNQIDEFACRQLDRVSYRLINSECLFFSNNDSAYLIFRSLLQAREIKPFQCALYLLTPHFYILSSSLTSIDGPQMDQNYPSPPFLPAPQTSACLM